MLDVILITVAVGPWWEQICAVKAGQFNRDLTLLLQEFLGIKRRHSKTMRPSLRRLQGAYDALTKRQTALN
ncbi:Rab5 interacting protein [Plakobranchus ocellatus]|uniref:Rab5 interacting protein n=1 Tax=Plakobranchus ocellatus TaxID=259542 RepID=A0AAV4AII8_9GAST|nr:Rab5 interacting protein [Plakobranchus ocellatus]